MDRVFKVTFMAGLLSTFVACSDSEFASGAAQNALRKAPKCIETSTKKCDPAKPYGPGTPVVPGSPGSDPTNPSNSDVPALSTSDGGLVVNVQVTKIHVKVDVDHVTDFIVNDKEMYAVHHELAQPKFSLVELFGPDGKLIDTQNWTMSFPGCDPYPKFDANCQSTKIQLKGGIKFKGKFTKQQGRRDVKLIQAPATVRVTDCGSQDCGSYGATGQKASGIGTYEWTVE